MKITKFYTNSKEALKVLPKDLVAKEIQQFEDKDIVFESNKVLGMVWDAATDELKFNSKFRSVDQWLEKFDIPHWTKRAVLKSTASTYDPLGLICPLTVHARAVIQSLWTQKLEWDDPIPQESTDRWLEALENLVNIHDIKLPRWLGIKDDNSYELHIFCDASEFVYACAAYIRVSSRGEVIHQGLISAKARVTPIKAETIPRLELIACVVGVRLARAVNIVLRTPPEKVHYWTDSEDALCWIHTTPQKCKVFAQNRVGEISRSTEISQWHHVPGIENPADVPTRFITSEELKNSKLWWQGPEFLRDSDNYPEFFPGGISPAVQAELKTESATYAFEILGLDPITDLVDRLSTGRLSNGYDKVVGIVTYIVRYVRKLKQKCSLIDDSRKQSTNLADCRKEAMTILIKKSQHQAFHEDIKRLKANQKLTEKSSIHRLNPFIDEEGVLRSQTRLGTLVQTSMANPIILHIMDPISQMIVTHAHFKYQHTVSLNAMIANLAKSYKILRLTRFVRELMKGCSICRRQIAKPRQQIMGELKKELKEQRPFAETGIDYAGPFSVKVGRGKTRKQMFVLVLTCQTTRCVHFEVCEDQKTSSVLNALTRFADIRGAPTLIRSDNQTSFTAARKELLQLITEENAEAVQHELQKRFNRPLTWEFIPPRAPHFGGSWEIVVKAMKRALKVITDGTDVNEDQFRTAVSQAASLLNSRPLSRELLDEKEIILTPNSFLIGQFDTSLAEHTANPGLSKLGIKYKEVIKIGQLVWKQFQRELLPEMAPRSKWFKIFPNLEPGNVVLVIEEDTPRGHWKTAIVEKVHNSADGRARSATIRMNGKSFKRPIVNLFPLFDQTNGGEN